MRRLAIILFAASLYASDPSLTLVSDVWKDPTLATLSGSLTATLDSECVTLSGTHIQPIAIKIAVASNGSFSRRLFPVSDACRALADGSAHHYNVTGAVGGIAITARKWYVLTTAVTQTLLDVEAGPPATVPDVAYANWPVTTKPSDTPTSGRAYVYASAAGVCLKLADGSEFCPGAGSVESVFGRTGVVTPDAADYSSFYAPIAKGVTNGDSHDHSGGDGAQIAYGSLSGLPTLGDAAAKNVGTGASDVATGNHAHAGVYEPVDNTILRQANLAGSGSATTPAKSDHSHTGTYEAVDATILRQANLAGSGSAVTPAKSDHNHSGTYQAAGSYEPSNANIQAHIGSTANPHTVTKAQVGLGSVDNTSDNNKPVSGPQQTALDTKIAGPASSTADHVPQFSGTTGKLLKDGLAVVTSVGSPGNDTNLPTEKAVATGLAGKEPALGNPASSGYVLSSTTAGARSWVAQASHTQNTDTGTSSSTFQIGTGGPKWKNNGGVLEARNAADDGYVPVTGSEFRAPSGTALTLSGAEQAAPTVSTPTCYIDSTTHLLTCKNGSNVVVGFLLPASQNVTGTAAGLSGTPALPNGTTATTQGASDNSTKLATTAYADGAAATRAAANPGASTNGGVKSGQCDTGTGKLMGYDTNGDRICETDQTGAAGGTVNSGAGNGFWFPFGYPGYQSGDTIAPAPSSANNGFMAQFITQAQTEWRYFGVYVQTNAGSSTTGMACGIWNATRTALVASSETKTGLNTQAGNGVSLQITGGSGVTGNVLTLPAGAYWLGCSSDDTTLRLAGYYAATGYGPNIMNSTASKKTVLSSTAISAGAGASLALTGNVSGATYIVGSNTAVVGFLN